MNACAYKLVLPLPGGEMQEFVLGETAASLGRGSTNDIVISDQKMSRAHARIDCSASGCVIEDLRSSNGTRVNGELVDKKTLQPGDVITLGNTSLKLESLGDVDDRDATMLDQTGLEVDVAENSIPIRLPDNQVVRVVVRSGDEVREFAIRGEALGIGRASDNEIVLPLPNVSRHHARIERSAQGYVLRDLNSENGTWIEQCRITKAILRHGDEFRIGTAQLAFKQSFSQEELVEADGREHARCPVVIVPGFGGSKLWLDKQQVWPGIGNLLGNAHSLKYNSQPLRAEGLVDQVVIIPNLLKLEQYSRLSDYVQEGLGYKNGKDLLEFAYDFRQDIRDSARELAKLIQDWPVPRPITIIAHSMGCLVSRYYVERLGGHKHIGKLILMGGPHNGTPKAFATLFMGPKLLPFGLLDSRLRELITTFPSTYQILPAYACIASEDGSQMDAFEHSNWLPERQRVMLNLGRDFRCELGRHASVPSVCVFGYGLKTITSVSLKSRPDGTHVIEPVIEPKGDGTIPETSAMLPECEIHPVRQYHGSLFVDNDVKMRLRIELLRSAN
ncbi:MAG TPA: FHA domain-containing protein [Terriglobales bacterium]|jgi:pSer/pThr/pTyr-binding forkhead associated (FHA) protein|nr:FHA domain-containing protein [Terriglobales bacterium]